MLNRSSYYPNVVAVKEIQISPKFSRKVNVCHWIHKEDKPNATLTSDALKSHLTEEFPEKLTACLKPSASVDEEARAQQYSIYRQCIYIPPALVLQKISINDKENQYLRENIRITQETIKKNLQNS